MARTDGITVRHRTACAKTTRPTARCSCSPGYRVRIDVPGVAARDRPSKTFDSLVKAQAWRADALREVRLGTLRAMSATTFRQAADEYVTGMKDGTIPNRSGETYKPSAVRGIDQAFTLRLVPAFGPRRLEEVRRADLQRAVERWRREGLNPSTIRNTVNAARALYRRAVSLDVVAIDPTNGLTLPAVTGRRERVAAPAEAAKLLEALPSAADRALWGLAVYGGLRLGEIVALTWDSIDLPAGQATGTIAVRRSWDHKSATAVAPKSAAGFRRVPVNRTLRALLAAHRRDAATLPTGATMVFPGSSPGRPVSYAGVYQRADRAWKAAGLASIRPHELRHTYASLMIAAGVQQKALSTWMGHATTAITQDRYGHLFPGDEEVGADALDRYLASAAT